ncbi:hypothetical protein G6O69_35660 [Pseudenhygromyxa sp. WMMC2535]|uniref:sensor histidine kinase n=1 Tax=Pseudenhygromyxa sp. WMMC2535 TaxID=2712867 RepID=UPI00155738C9|nr:HAMP domain-containing sensor histidine kinase [Pseudenhygromyxa sp. WMMC2535]NVB43216.1 hypothetical protein [Pseudenhygromyxa sp. WMMC2535]
MSRAFSRRLVTEQRSLGLLAALSLLHLLFGLTWAALTLDDAAIAALVELRLAPMLIALPLAGGLVALSLVSARFPQARWPPEPSSGPPPSPWPLALAGAPSLLLWPVSILRDRQAWTHRPDGEEVELAFRELLRLPRIATQSLLVWLGLASVVDVFVLSEALELPALPTASLLGLWLTSLLPLATLAAGQLRALLVPEYLSAPRPNPTAMPAPRRLSLRLGVPAGLALAAAVLTPALAGLAWSARVEPDQPGPSALLLLLLVAFGLASGATSLALLLRDVERDLGRASRQVGAVADGEIPEPMAVETFATRELREIVAAVDRLVGRITDANVAKYVLIEKGQEADRLKGQFLANMSHDLRSPLNSVIGFSELLTTGIEGELEPDQHAMIQAIHAAGRSLLQQIDDVLDTAKIEAGRMELHPEPTPPATLISRAIERARPHLDPRVEIDTRFAAGLPPAFADPYRSAQALENVLRFAGEGLGVGQEIRVTCTALREANAPDRAQLLIRVTSPRTLESRETLEQAQRGFVRVPGQSGLGLGLPIATSIFELQGGSLRVEADATPDQGPVERPKDQDTLSFELRVPALVARRSPRFRLR